MVVTPSSIPSSTTRKPNIDLSSEGSDEVLEDSDDEPTIRKMISDSDEEKGDDHEAETMGTSLLYLFKLSLRLLSLPSSSFFLLYVSA